MGPVQSVHEPSHGLNHADVDASIQVLGIGLDPQTALVEVNSVAELVIQFEPFQVRCVFEREENKQINPTRPPARVVRLLSNVCLKRDFSNF